MRAHTASQPNWERMHHYPDYEVVIPGSWELAHYHRSLLIYRSIEGEYTPLPDEATGRDKNFLSRQDAMETIYYLL